MVNGVFPLGVPVHKVLLVLLAFVADDGANTNIWVQRLNMSQVNLVQPLSNLDLGPGITTRSPCTGVQNRPGLVSFPFQIQPGSEIDSFLSFVLLIFYIF